MTSNGNGGIRFAFRNTLFETGFTAVPNVVLDSPRLLPEEKLLFCLYLRYAYTKASTYVSQETLAQLCGATERTIRRWNEALVQCGLVTVTRPDRNRGNVYLIDLDSPKVLAELAKPRPVPDRTPVSGPERTLVSGHE
jgi:hypothetical protein